MIKYLKVFAQVMILVAWLLWITKVIDFETAVMVCMLSLLTLSNDEEEAKK